LGVLALWAGGCFGAGAQEKDRALDPTVLDKTVEDASFHVRVP
jgi:hypothetical protein